MTRSKKKSTTDGETPYGQLQHGMTKYRKGPQRTAKEHYGLSCRKLTPIELNGVLYSSARQDFSHAAGLIENLSGRRCQSRSGSASGTLCSRWHAKALLHGKQQSTSTDGSLIVLHRPESRCWEETGKSSSTKCRPHKTRSKN